MSRGEGLLDNVCWPFLLGLRCRAGIRLRDNFSELYQVLQFQQRVRPIPWVNALISVRYVDGNVSPVC